MSQIKDLILLGLLLISFALGLRLFFVSQRADHIWKQYRQIQMLNSACLDANQSNQTVIEGLSTANSKFKQQAEQAQKAQQQLIQTLKQSVSNQAEQIANMRRERDAIYLNNETVRQWGDTAVPAVVFGSLLAESHNAN